MAKLPDDPRDFYVYHETGVSLRQLANTYAGKRGCSQDWLTTRCSREKWVQLRQEYLDETAAKTKEKKIERNAERQVKSLTDLNVEAIRRTEMLIQITEAAIKQGIVDDKNNPGKKKITHTASELRRLTQNLIDLAHEMRLHHNYWPDRPIDDAPVADTAEGERLVDELFGNLFS